MQNSYIKKCVHTIACKDVLTISPQMLKSAHMEKINQRNIADYNQSTTVSWRFLSDVLMTYVRVLLRYTAKRNFIGYGVGLCHTHFYF